MEVHRLRRRWQWVRSTTPVARGHDETSLPIRVIKHKSLLLRTLGDTDMRLQHNKVTNLRVATSCVDGLLIRPGEEFSFCRTVGRATARKGYVEGMLLDSGQAAAGVGGGICQLANLLHWMVLHSPLTVTERSEHSFDPFSDQGRVLPWGVGCAVYFNYVDLRSVTTPTPTPPSSSGWAWVSATSKASCAAPTPSPTRTRWPRSTRDSNWSTADGFDTTRSGGT